MGLAFIFKSVINLKLFFMCSVREGLSVLFCFACKVTQLFQHHFWKYFHFPIVLVWHFCWKSNVHLNIWLFLDSSFCSTDLCVCAFAYHTALITIALQVLKSGSVYLPTLLLSEWFFMVSRSFLFPYEMRNHPVSFFKKVSAGIFIVISLNL